MHAGTTAIVALLALLSLGACASPIPEGPPAWREGYAQGCDSGASAAGNPSRRYVRDVQRERTDALYAQGWQAGYDACRARYENAGRAVSP